MCEECFLSLLHQLCEILQSLGEKHSGRKKDIFFNPTFFPTYSQREYARDSILESMCTIYKGNISSQNDLHLKNYQRKLCHELKQQLYGKRFLLLIASFSLSCNNSENILILKKLFMNSFFPTTAQCCTRINVNYSWRKFW